MSYREFLDTLPCPALLLDMETWKPTVFNNHANECLGYSPGEFEKLTITDFEVVPNPSETRDHIAAIRASRSDAFPSVQREKNGRPVHLRVRLNVINFQGRDVMLALWEPRTVAHEVAPTALQTPSEASWLWRERRIVAESERMRKVLARVEKLARTTLPVLITGETGTGKDLVARRLHDQSHRAARTFMPVNCATIPGDLLDGELFGVERGAFTGAEQRRAGRFEVAQGGTVFLDEVGELSLLAQAKLLRVLQDGEIHRLGAALPQRVDVRIIAATNRDLANMVIRGTFRLDLYHRLAGASVELPPLRDRPEDIEPLVAHAISLLAADRVTRFFSKADMDRLRRWSWPGNVRELMRTVETAAALSSDGRLDLDGWLPISIGGEQGPATTLDAAIRAHVLRTLEACDWTIEGASGAAARLGLRPSTLRSKMQKLGIRRA